MLIFRILLFPSPLTVTVFTKAGLMPLTKEQNAERMRKRMANMSAEEREQHLVRRRKWYRDNPVSEEDRIRRNQRQKEYHDTHRDEHVTRMLAQYRGLTHDEKEGRKCRQREIKREDKIRAFDYFGWECFDCGETDINVIEFDHIPEKGPKLANPSKLMGMAHFYEVTEKCEPVCCNCHRKRTISRHQERHTGIPLAN